MIARRQTLFALFTILVLVPLLLGARRGGCQRADDEETLTQAEAQTAVDESVSATAAATMTTETIEVTTDFTIGMAVEDAAAEIATFIESQIPCTTTTVEGATVTVDYGTLDDNCVYNGNTYAGVHTITVESNEPAQVELAHGWQDFTNGNVTVNGTADVTWSGESDLERHVVHELTWDDGERTVVGSGDRRQTLIDPDQGVAGGIQIDGSRSWQTERGIWSLSIDGVQVRGQDPVPQAGTYTLTTPDDKVLAMGFSRIDENTIEVTVTGTRRDFTFRVSSSGDVASE